jgi:hypothetical protein
VTLNQLVSPIKSIIAAVSDLVETTHKQAAVVLGLLATTGVIGVPAGSKLGGGALLLYAAIVHTAENLFAPSNQPVLPSTKLTSTNSINS